jgi:hypothetical protein
MKIVFGQEKIVEIANAKDLILLFLDSRFCGNDRWSGNDRWWNDKRETITPSNFYSFSFTFASFFGIFASVNKEML